MADSPDSQSTGTRPGSRRGDRDVAATTPVLQFPDTAWDARRERLEQLYLVEDRDLKDIIELMREDGFQATRKQYLRHFKRWHIEKNIKTHEYRAMVRIQNRRLQEGKQTEFKVRKRAVPRDKISRFLRKYNDTADDEDASSPAQPGTPPDIEYGTPLLQPAELHDIRQPPPLPDVFDLHVHLPVHVPVHAPIPDALVLDAGPPAALDDVPYYDLFQRLASDQAGRHAHEFGPPPGLDGRFDTPLTYAQPENVLSSIRRYFDGYLESGAWAVAPGLTKPIRPSSGPSSYALFDFIHVMEEAIFRLRDGRATAETFRLLNIGFSLLKAILTSEDLQVLPNLLVIFMQFYDHPVRLTDLGRVFINYCAELSTTVLGNHPFTVVFCQLVQLDADQGFDSAGHEWPQIQKMLVGYFGCIDQASLTYETVNLRKIARMMGLHPEYNLQSLLQAKAELAQSDQPNMAAAWWIHFRIAETYLDDMGDFAQARRYLSELDNTTLGPEVRLLWNLRLAEAHIGLGESGPAVSILNAALSLCQHRSEKVRVLSMLQKAHHRSGHEQAAASVSHGIMVTIAEMESCVPSP